MSKTKRWPPCKAMACGRSAARRLFSVALLCCLTTAPLPALAQSRSVTVDAKGKLTYGHLERGDRIADFSTAGYRGGGALPAVITKRTVRPTGEDGTAAIQQALDAVAERPRVDGHRGAVLLAAGIFHCSETRHVTASGVVLRGDPRGSTIEMTGVPHLALTVAGKLTQKAVTAPTVIADAYAPSGASSFDIADASLFHAGDIVPIASR